MRNVSATFVAKFKHTFYAQRHFPENRAVYGIMWKYMVQPDRPQMAIRRMILACWITKAINTRSEYVILIFLPRQQWLRERA